MGKLKFQSRDHLVPFPGGVAPDSFELLLQIAPLRDAEREQTESAENCGMNNFLPQAGGGTGLGVASVVDKSFGGFTDQGIPAALAGQATAIEEIILLGPCAQLSGEHGLHTVERRFGDQRLMDTGEALPRFLDPDQTEIERVVEKLREPVLQECAAIFPPQSDPPEFSRKLPQRESTGRVQLKSLSDQRRSGRIESLGLARAVIEVANRRLHRIKALLESPVKSLLDLLPEVSAVIRGHDGLNVGRQPAASRSQVQTLVDEVNFDAAIEQFIDLGPILNIAGAAVDLVDDDARGGTAHEQLQHQIENRPPLFGSGFLFFKPPADRELALLRVAFNGFPLLGQGDSLLSLPRGGHAYICEVLPHFGFAGLISVKAGRILADGMLHPGCAIVK